MADQEVETSEDGTFDFSVPPGEYLLEVAHPAHTRALLSVNLLAGEARTIDVTLDEVQDPGDDVGQLSGRALLAGQLALPDGERDHSGINVEVTGAGVRVTTNSAGQFDLFLRAGHLHPRV